MPKRTEDQDEAGARCEADVLARSVELLQEFQRAIGGGARPPWVPVGAWTRALVLSVRHDEGCGEGLLRLIEELSVLEAAGRHGCPIHPNGFVPATTPPGW
jgi:hypothetical protein